MIAISIRHPWAWLIAYGYKPVENRDCAGDRTPPIIVQARKAIGQRIAIHASLGFSNDTLEQARAAIYDLIDLAGLPQRYDEPELQEMRATLGMIVATAVIDRVIRHGDGDPLNGDRYRTKERFALVLRDVVRLSEPLTASGALGLWAVPPTIAAAVERQYGTPVQPIEVPPEGEEEDDGFCCAANTRGCGCALQFGSDTFLCECECHGGDEESEAAVAP